MGAGPSRVPEDHHEAGDGQDIGTLVEDLTAIVEDGRTYLDAELQFQKSRAGYIGGLLGKSAGLGAGAALCVLLALIALTLGLLLGLAPLITIWGATAVVVIAWLVLAAVCGLSARRRVRAIQQAMAKRPREQA